MPNCLRNFVKRGVNSTTALIAGTISAHSVHTAPATLAQTISTVALAKDATAGGSTFALAKGALKLMTCTRAKAAQYQHLPAKPGPPWQKPPHPQLKDDANGLLDNNWELVSGGNWIAN